MLRERIFVLTRSTSPSFKSEIDLCIGIQDRLASLARHWRILNQSHVLYFLHGGVHATNGHDDARGTYFITGPKVPAKPDSIL